MRGCAHARGDAPSAAPASTLPYETPASTAPPLTLSPSSADLATLAPLLAAHPEGLPGGRVAEVRVLRGLFPPSGCALRLPGGFAAVQTLALAACMFVRDDSKAPVWHTPLHAGLWTPPAASALGCFIAFGDEKLQRIACRSISTAARALGPRLLPVPRLVASIGCALSSRLSGPSLPASPYPPGCRRLLSWALSLTGLALSQHHALLPPSEARASTPPLTRRTPTSTRTPP